MKAIAVASVVSLTLVVSLALGESALARTPTPTATPAATDTPLPTPCPSATPTVAPEQLAQFFGEVWLYVPGPYPPGAVTARIDGTACSVPAYIPPVSCGQPPPVTPPSDPGPITGKYAISVLSASERPGCGYEGAQVDFYVGDTRATATATWHAGESQQVNVTTLPPFAFFHGQFTLTFQPSPEIGVDGPAGMIALVGNKPCGRALRGIWLPRDPRSGGVYDYWAQVYSDEWQDGCGIDGDKVAFELIWNTSGTGDVSNGDVVGVAREKGVWHAWGDGNTGIELNLTFDPPNAIALASVGDGASRDSDAGAWAELALGLSVLGLFGIAAAAAIRRIATTR
jgi:hypothetical protein